MVFYNKITQNRYVFYIISYINIIYRYKLIVKYSSDTLGIMLSRLVYVLRDKMLLVLYYFDVIMVAAIVYDIISKIIYYVGVFATGKAKKE